jgi:FMN-dependent NADH-azoreductase
MPQMIIFDAITGETITRDLNETELAQIDADIAQAKKDAAAQAKADQAVADKRQIILDRLGLTADEFKTLIS